MRPLRWFFRQIFCHFNHSLYICAAFSQEMPSYLLNRQTNYHLEKA